jgi:hypothetical protein
MATEQPAQKLHFYQVNMLPFNIIDASSHKHPEEHFDLLLHFFVAS